MPDDHAQSGALKPGPLNPSAEGSFDDLISWIEADLPSARKTIELSGDDLFFQKFKAITGTADVKELVFYTFTNEYKLTIYPPNHLIGQTDKEEIRVPLWTMSLRLEARKARPGEGTPRWKYLGNDCLPVRYSNWLRLLTRVVDAELQNLAKSKHANLISPLKNVFGEVVSPKYANAVRKANRERKAR